LPIPTKDGGTLPIAVLKDAKLDVSKLADEGGALQQARDAFASQVARNIRPSVR
jgi:hypothetical protein